MYDTQIIPESLERTRDECKRDASRLDATLMNEGRLHPILNGAPQFTSNLEVGAWESSREPICKPISDTRYPFEKNLHAHPVQFNLEFLELAYQREDSRANWVCFVHREPIFLWRKVSDINLLWYMSQYALRVRCALSLVRGNWLIGNGLSSFKSLDLKVCQPLRLYIGHILSCPEPHISEVCVNRCSGAGGIKSRYLWSSLDSRRHTLNYFIEWWLRRHRRRWSRCLFLIIPQYRELLLNLAKGITKVKDTHNSQKCRNAFSLTHRWEN